MSTIPTAIFEFVNVTENLTSKHDDPQLPELKYKWELESHHHIKNQQEYVKPFQLEAHKCNVCTFKTDFKLRLHEHCKIVHAHYSLTNSSDKELKCEHCDSTTYSYLYLTKRHINCKTVKWFQCKQCSYKSKVKRQLTGHMLEHLKSKPYSCEQCPFTTNRLVCLTRHMLSHAEVTWISCELCSYKGRSKRHLKKHMTKHSLHWLHCEKCVFVTKYKWSLKQHVKQHTNQSDWFQCKQCSFKTARKESWKRHMSQQHASNIRWFKCEQCSHRAKSKGNLKTHVQRKHLDPTKIVWLKCSKCPYETKCATYLNRHMVIHSEYHDIYARYSKEAKDEYNSRRQRTDESVPDEMKRYKCERCSYKTMYVSLLREHVSICLKNDV